MPDTPAYEVSTNTSATRGDIGLGKLFLNVSSAANFTLPPSIEGADCEIFNTGDSDLTVKKPDTNTLCTISAGEYARIFTVIDSSGVPQWYATTPASY